MNIYFETLGCAKNDVDTEMMQGLLDRERYTVVSRSDDADVIFVNTCGFIEAAKEESIDMILSLAQMKKTASLKKLFVTGCLSQRYPEELMKEIPEIDGILGPGYLSRINEFLQEDREKKSWTENMEENYIEGVRKFSGNISQYIKISEGCNNRCSYCIIPYLRGNNRSRRIEDIVEEVRECVKSGTKEIILIAQNTTDYGIDRYGKYALLDLLQELEKVEDLRWIRVMYGYPDHFSKDLIRWFKTSKKVVPYIDMPLQHGSREILKKMNRKTTPEQALAKIQELREEVPGITIRSTFIVGFPGETEDHFNELLHFLQQARLDRVGAFTYSREEGTPAAEFSDQVPQEVMDQRLDQLMKVQQDISEEKLKSRVGTVLEVLIEGEVEEGLYEGRSSMDAPEIDGVVYVSSEKTLNIGDMVRVEITDSTEFDCYGVCL